MTGANLPRRSTVLALVSDAFGGHGGIAQYNRDLLGALAQSGTAAAVLVLPRHASDPVAVPDGVGQLPARRGRLAYSMRAVLTAWRWRPDIVFCGHLYMAPLA
ncbi:MAG TPA: hypothetical protein VGF07_04030, partial [Stellaceae bacterium]